MLGQGTLPDREARVLQSHTVSPNEGKRRAHSVTPFMRLPNAGKSITSKENYRLISLIA